jgi:hypothetical protein
MAVNLRGLENVNFGTLNSSKNKHVVKYVASSDTYELVSADSVLSSSNVLDGDLPDDFVNQIESEIDPDNLEILGYDGGGF